MADSFTFKVEGLATLEKRLEELGVRTYQNVLRKALRAAAKPVVAEAKARAMAQLKKRSGRLFKGIKAVTGGKYGQAYIKVGFGKGARHGIPLELGTTFFAARPMLRPALDMRAGEAVAIFKARMAEEIDKAVKT